MPVLKLKQYPVGRLVADGTLTAHNTEQELRAAQYELDIKLHYLRTEFTAREGKLRQDFLDRVEEIAGS